MPCDDGDVDEYEDDDDVSEDYDGHNDDGDDVCTYGCLD